MKFSRLCSIIVCGDGKPMNKVGPPLPILFNYDSFRPEHHSLIHNPVPKSFYFKIWFTYLEIVAILFITNKAKYFAGRVSA